MMEKMMGQMGKGKMPALPGLDGMAGCAMPGGAARRGPALAPHPAEETEGQQETVGSSVTCRHGSQAQAHPCGLQEEPDLPRGRGRLAFPP